RACHAFLGDGVRTEAGEAFAIEANAAAARLYTAGQHVEERGLAGTVGAHDAVHLAFGNGQVHLLEDHAITEAHMHTLGFEQRHHPLRNSSRSMDAPRALMARRSSTDLIMPAMPSGRNSTKATNSSPK